MSKQFRFVKRLAFTSLCIGLSACSGGIEQSMARSIRHRLARSPVTETVGLRLPDGDLLYDAAGNPVKNAFAVLRPGDKPELRRGLDALVEAGWLRKHRVHVWTRANTSFGLEPTLALTLDNDPKLAARAARALQALPAALHAVTVRVGPAWRHPVYYSDAAMKNGKAVLPNRPPAHFFMAVGPYTHLGTPHAKALRALVAAGYLTEEKPAAYEIDFGQAYVAHLHPKPRTATKKRIRAYFLTAKAGNLLARVTRPGNRTMAVAYVANARPVAALGIGETFDGSRTVYFQAALSKTPLANLRPIDSLLGKKARERLAKAGTRPLQATVTFKDAGLTQYQPNSFRLRRYESGPRKQLDVYSVAPGARQRFTAGGTLAIGRWTFGKITNYSKGRVRGEGGRLVEFTLRFEPALKAGELRALKPFLEQKVAAAGAVKNYQCILTRMRRGWKVRRCGTDNDGM